MDGAKRETSTVPSLPPPLPKSPPPYPDLYGKRRELARVQMLEREIGFLQVYLYLHFLKSLAVFDVLFYSLFLPFWAITFFDYILFSFSFCFHCTSYFRMCPSHCHI